MALDINKFDNGELDLASIQEGAVGISAKDNTTKIDEYTDRFGNTLPTLPKILGDGEAKFDASIAQKEHEFYLQVQYKPSIPWSANTPISDKTQLYSSTGDKRYRPKPDKVPFTTGATIDDDIANGLWIAYGEATQEWTNNKINEGDSQLAGGGIYPLDTSSSASTSSPNNNAPAGTIALRNANSGQLFMLDRPASGVITALDFTKGTATIGGNDGVGLIPIIINEMVNVRAFGAKGDFYIATINPIARGIGSTYNDLVNPSATDDTAAFEKAIEFARPTSRMIYAPSGGYLLTRGLFFGPKTEEDANLFPTQARNICPGLAGDGNQSTYLIPRMSGGQVLDMSGLREKYLRDFRMDQLDSANMPDIGILTARFFRPKVNAPTNNDFGRFDNITLNGYFAFADYFAHATEEIVCEQCRFYNRADTALGAWVSSDNITLEGYTPTKSTSAQMDFATGTLSNLHQTHINCDYALDTESPTRNNLAMCFISGSMMVHIEMPFFNNNKVNHDCVRAEKGGSANINGIHVRGANAHKETKCGMRLVDANVGCSWTESTSTVGFSEGNIIVEGSTSAFDADWLYGDLIVNAQMVGCNLGSIRNLVWDTQHPIQLCELTVRGEVKASTTGTPSFANNVEISIGNTTSIVRGQWSTPSNAALDVQIGVQGARGIEIGTNYQSFNDSLVSFNVRQGSGQGYDFWRCEDSGQVVAQMRKGGALFFNISSGGPWLTSNNGTKYRVLVADDGTLTTSRT